MLDQEILRKLLTICTVTNDRHHENVFSTLNNRIIIYDDTIPRTLLYRFAPPRKRLVSRFAFSLSLSLLPLSLATLLLFARKRARSMIIRDCTELVPVSGESFPFNSSRNSRAGTDGKSHARTISVFSGFCIRTMGALAKGA